MRDMEKRKRPILFSGPMVRSILSGAKSQTRRVMKEQPPDEDFDIGFYHPTLIDRKGEEYPGDEVFGAFARDGSWGIKSPFVPGMTLWVRETWRTYERIVSNNRGIQYRADGIRLPIENTRDDKSDWAQTHREDDKWRPSIFMPRWASRLTLEVIDVRVEQIQNITADDAELEGIELHDFENRVTGDVEQCYSCGDIQGDSPREVFRELWDSIAKPGEKWADSPYVWAVTFKRVDNGR